MTRPTPRRVIVTGATRGLGRAMAQGIYDAGHLVFGCGRDEARCQAMNETFADTRARFSVVDVTEEASVQDWAQTLLAEQGAPDLLINNAALINTNAPLWDVPEAEFERIMATNVGGIARVIRHFVPAMIAQGAGVIVNFSSYWGRSASAEVGPYCASKFAVEGLTESLARELPDGVATVALNPGVIDTDMLRQCFGGSAAHHLSPEAWARSAVPFLLSLGPSHNGQSLTVPGQ